jgi:FKBP-type peptidyl-prolyl cis-trans isomerase
MKKRCLPILALLILLAPGCSQETDDFPLAKKFVVKTEKNKISYAVGYRLGRQLQALTKNNDIQLSFALQGIFDAATETSQMEIAEVVKIYHRFQKKMDRLRQKAQKIKNQRNKAAGEKFLLENLKNKGVTATSSGLQYMIVQAGHGPSPGPAKVAVVHYRGTLIDGSEIFSSYKQNRPVKIPIRNALPFWKEILPKMKTGAKFRLFIPPGLAYKDHGNPPLIEPNVVLIYDAELVAVE